MNNDMLHRNAVTKAENSFAQMSISVFFPALNEEDTVERLTQDLLSLIRSTFERGEVIVINDGSTDRTKEILDRLARENDGYVRAIHNSESRGYGNALKAGFNAAKGDLVFFTDGDYQFDVNDLYRALPLIEEFDIVVGYRKNRQDPRYRLLLSKGYNLLVRILFGLKLRDIDCSFKLFRQSALKKISIESVGYFIDTEIMINAQKEGLRIKEIDVRHLPRISGVSKVKMKHIYTTLCEIFALWKKVRKR